MVAIIHTSVMHLPIIENGVTRNTLHLLKACLFTHFESHDQLMTYEAKEVRILI